MKINEPKELQPGMNIRCYACDERTATHVCRYKIDELMVQVCLCAECMKIDTEHLIKNTIGIGKPSKSSPGDYLVL